jgi:hypothetical protein
MAVNGNGSSQKNPVAHMPYKRTGNAKQPPQVPSIYYYCLSYKLS